MRRVFQSLDINNDYYLSKDELVDGLKFMGLGDAKKASKEIFRLIDTNGDGKI